MTSWKTTLFGILGGLGTLGAMLSHFEGGPAWVTGLAVALVALGQIGNGLSGRDNNVSSEAAGAKPSVPAVVIREAEVPPVARVP